MYDCNCCAGRQRQSKGRKRRSNEGGQHSNLEKRSSRTSLSNVTRGMCFSLNPNELELGIGKGIMPISQMGEQIIAA